MGHTFSKINRLVASTLILQLLLAPIISGRGQSARADSGASGGLPFEYDASYAREMGLLQMDPKIAELESQTLGSGFDLILKANDPLVDGNPFFMNGQRWSKADRVSEEERGEAEFATSADSVSIRPAGIERSLRIPVALTPILATSEYIFLTARDAQFFERRGGGEGLFVIPVIRLTEASATGAHVPVFFFPLPGTGWTGPLSAHEIPHEDLVILKDNKGVELPLLVEDVRTLVRIGTTSLLFASNQALLGAVRKLRESGSAEARRVRDSLLALARQVNGSSDATVAAKKFQEHQTAVESAIERILGTEEIALTPGSTAGFGLVYIGEGAVGGSLRASVSDWLLPSAHAGLDPHVVEFLMKTGRVLGISGLVLSGSVLARYTLLKQVREERLQEAQRRLTDGATEQGDGKIGKRFKWDVFAHAMTTLAQLPSVWSAKTLQLLMDKLYVGENNVIRRLFNKTFGFSLRTNDQTPTNARSLMLGVVVLGGVDTAMVALQGYLLLPALADVLAWVFPALQGRVDAAYHSGDAAVSLFLMLGLVQNVVAWIQSGAYNFAHDVQVNKTLEGQRVVADQMRTEGKNAESDGKLEYERRVREYVRRAMKSQGLAADKEFLFDANTLYAKLLGFFGYEKSEAVQEAEDAAGEAGGVRAGAKFRALERPGLTYRALKRALQAARTDVQSDPSNVEAQEALALLEGAEARMAPLKHFVRTFFAPTGMRERERMTREGLLNLVREFRQIRSDLAMLTVEGPADSVPEILPRSWTPQAEPGGAYRSGSGASSDGSARLAASCFRKAFFSLIDGAKKANPVYGWVGKVLTAPFRFVSRLYQNWQIRRAQSRATARFVRENGRAPEQRGEDAKAWEEVLKTELNHEMGLYPEYSDADLLKEVQKKAIEKVGQRLATDKELFAEIDARIEKVERAIEQAGNPKAKARLEEKLEDLLEKRDLKRSMVEAEYFAETYVEMTVLRDDPNPQDSRSFSELKLSPNQPGVFQKIRNTKRVKSSRMLTQVFRGLEGMMSNSRYKLGLWSKVARGVPLLDDMVQGTTATFRNLPVSATIGYWWSMHLWGSAYPRMTWFINTVLMAGPLIRGMWMSSFRMTDNMGIKAGDKVGGMIKYGLIGSFATMWGMFFYPMYQADIVNGVTAATGVAGDLVNSCIRALGGG